MKSNAGKRTAGPPSSPWPSPSDPMAVARRVVVEQFPDDGFAYWRGDFYAFTGTHWRILDHEEFEAAAYLALEHAVYAAEKGFADWNPTKHKVANVLDAAKAVNHLPRRLDPPFLLPDGSAVDPELIVMGNGMLHLPTRTLRPHSRDLFVITALPFYYDANAPPPLRWLTFLSQIWPDDQASVETLQEIAGYLISGSTSQQKIFALIGPRRSGKGTIFRTLGALLGKENVVSPTMAALNTQFGLQPLIGKLAALVSDARFNSRHDAITERLLSVSGEDLVTADRKYKRAWTGQLPTRFFIATNEMPRFADASGALASRFIALPMVKSFYGSENPNLTAELLTEIPAVFNWALDGLDRLRSRGYFQPPESSRVAVDQMQDLSSPVFAFVKGECVMGEGHSVPVDELWTHWKAWCEIENCRNGTKSSFARNLKAAFPEISDTRPSINGKRVRVYQGIALRAEPDEEPEEEPEPAFPELEPLPFVTVEDIVELFSGWVDDCHEERCQ